MVSISLDISSTSSETAGIIIPQTPVVSAENQRALDEEPFIASYVKKFEPVQTHDIKSFAFT